MNSKSISAYDVAARVATYDADMEVMHPNRTRMVDVALEFLPLARDTEMHVLELGCGTGYLTQRLLTAYPSARVVAVDGAQSMLELATSRLGALNERVDSRVGDFRELDRLVQPDPLSDAVLSSYALHHLDRDDKLQVLVASSSRLKPGGWFINADLIESDSAEVEDRFQQLRVAGIVRRAAADDGRFSSPSATQQYLDELEANEHDQPLKLLQDLEVLRSAGLEHVCVLWLEYREAVVAGRKPTM